MSRTYDPKVVMDLMVNCGGRCTICNKDVMNDWRIHKRVNTAEKAHIKAFSDLGPRPDKSLSKQERNSYDNLMVLCPSCHSTIDEKVASKEYTVEWLRQKKKDKEERIKRILDVLNDKESDFIKYSSAIGNQNFNINDDDICGNCFVNNFFSHNDIINLGEDINEEDIETSIKELCKKFETRIQRGIDNGKSSTYCLFAKAPQPLLIYLGRLFNDKHDVKIFTSHRDNVWKYNDLISNVKFSICKPTSCNKENSVVIVVNSTATVDHERVKKVFGTGVDIWEINASEIGVDKINNQEELKNFYSIVVNVLDDIGFIYGKDKIINLMPVMCNSLAITFGRAIFCKAHNKINIYDSKRDENDVIVDELSLTI